MLDMNWRLLYSPCSPKFLLPFLLCLIFNIIPPCSSSSNIPTCSSLRFSCGNITDVDYPFWGESRPQRCGYSPLKLSCDPKNNQTTIRIANVTYHVLELNQTSNILKIARYDFSEGICSPGTGNTELDHQGAFEYAPGSVAISFFYNCTKPSSPFLEGYFSCPRGSVYKDGYALVGPETEIGICSSSVTVGIQGIYYGFRNNLAKMEEALREGFQLKYTTTVNTESEPTILEPPTPMALSRNGSSLKHYLIIAGVPATICGVIVISILIIYSYKRKSKISSEKGKSDQFDVEEFIKSNYAFTLTPKRCTYASVKRMSNSFAEKIGEGGFSIVYKGQLLNGTAVAIKVLKQAKGNGEDFINEVASIGNTLHKNIVTLLKYCYEGNNRALIYEYMPRGSLDKFIFNQGSLNTNNNINITRLEWKTLYQIAIGIARGLDYLHQDCTSSILHFDIKPHNILLDFDFCPKISDFGLAKLCKRDGSSLSLLNGRGTAGYTAPEMYSKNFGEVSYKSDVYSYGMMVLEMVGGRRNIDAGVSRTSKIYYPYWVHKHVDDDDGEYLKNICEEMVNEDDEMLARKMIIVSLWCIQAMPSNRPSMSEVVSMMEGSLQSLQMPPKPTLSLQNE